MLSIDQQHRPVGEVPIDQPYPRVGRGERWRFYRDPGTWATQVKCTYCGARGPLCVLDEDEALAAWSEPAPIPA
jgi:hypothetical protein